MTYTQQLVAKLQIYGELRQKHPASEKAELMKAAIAEVEGGHEYRGRGRIAA